MKITRLEIKDFNQFRDLDIDLTYPKGHEKEGLPLEKVCFIGQSGTGKTTLLKLIYGLSYDIGVLKELGYEKIANKIHISLLLNELAIKKTIFSAAELSNLLYKWNSYKYEGKSIELAESTI